MSRNKVVEFGTLLGKTFVKVKKVEDDELRFVTDTGDTYEMFHVQNCCESVVIEDICGELDWLVDSPILLAEESTNADEPPAEGADYSWTWTFYHLRTQKGTVTVRWFGTSNGYYSEDVELYLKPNENPA